MVRRVLTIVALGIFLSAQQAAASGQEGVIASGKPRIAGHVLSALQRAKPIRVTVDAVNADQPLSLTIVLNRDDPAGFDRFLADVYNPLSPRFRRFLSPTEISDRFGPSKADFDVVAGYLQDQGFTVTDTSPNRMTMVVAGTRGLVEKAFHLNLGDYELSGRRFFANDADPELPAFVAPHVEAIVGLNDLARPKSTSWVILGICLLAVTLAALAVMFLAPEVAIVLFETVITELATACLGGAVEQYAETWVKIFQHGHGAASFANSAGESVGGMAGAGLDWRSIDGTGQTIGLLEFDSFLKSDVSDWLALAGGGIFPVGPMSNLTVKSVNGGVPVPGSGESEVLLDVDAVMRFAPGAHYVVYEAPFSGGASFQSLFNSMINDHVTVIGNSWSYCEDQTTLADVQSIDSILATAAASGISVFNGSGDTGSTCLDGAPDTIGVPSDSPHATAVGGTSATPGVGFTYGSETWWDGNASTPPSGQGGFGVSKFFFRPGYQNGFNASPMRSVPDVAATADPRSGLQICQADKGGCPSGLSYGGTSMATPVWAAMAALLNQAHGSNLGLLNPVIYPFGNTHAFHSAASMGSDFSHVGLGSPNLNILSLKIDGESAGPVSAADSLVLAGSRDVPSDGVSQAVVQVNLIDDHGNGVSGKTVSLTADGSAIVSPPSGPSSVNGGAVTFLVTDNVIEAVTFHATDVTDGFPLTMSASMHFLAPAATSGNVVASPATVIANGVATTTITVTLHDANNNGAVGKTVTLAQGAGRSLISGPTPATTDANGQLVFTATDTFTENVTYTGTDVTDGNLPVPDTGTSTVSFTGGSGSSCAVGQEVPQPGWAVTSPETGFVQSSNCVGVSGTAWDPQGNLWAMDYGNGNLYKFPPAGGSASAGTLVGTVNASNCPHGLAFSKDGQHLYLAEQFCGFGGDVVELSLADASIVKHLTTADAVHCATGIATDPLSGDLFVASPCQSGDNLWRISNPESSSPTLSVYAHPGLAIGLNFTPDGTIWTEGYPGNKLVKISATNSGSPGTVTVLSTNAPPFAGGVLPVLNAAHPGSPSFLFVTNGATGGNSGSTQKVDLTQNPPVFSPVAAAATGAIFVDGGPDGCAYVSNGDRIDRITAADGTCDFATASTVPTLSLSPVSASPAQGGTQTMTAQFSHLAVPPGTFVRFLITGANPQIRLGKTNGSGTASISYTGVFAGIDGVVASAMLAGNTYFSNTAMIAWTAGRDVTFLSLNGCPTSDKPGVAVMLSAGLFDASQTPPVPIPGAPIHFAVGNLSCDGVTDGTGVASCSITPTAGGTFELSVTYAGSAATGASPHGEVPALLYDPTSASESFLVIGPPPPPETSSIPTLDPRALVLLGVLLAGAGMLAAKKMR